MPSKDTVEYLLDDLLEPLLDRAFRFWSIMALGAYPPRALMLESKPDWMAPS